MTTEEIKLLLDTTKKRMAEIEPLKEKAYQKFLVLQKQVAELSKPMEAARDDWSVFYTEFESLKVIQTLYAAELEKDGGATA